MEIPQNVAAAGQENTDAYLVVMCDITGEGVTHEGTLVNIGSADYFLDAVGATQKYTYSSDDGVTGKSCIISAVPIHKGNLVVGFLYSYFDEIIFNPYDTAFIYLGTVQKLLMK